MRRSGWGSENAEERPEKQAGAQRGWGGQGVGVPQRRANAGERAGTWTRRRQAGSGGGTGVGGRAVARVERLWLHHVPQAAFSGIRPGGWREGEVGEPV